MHLTSCCPRRYSLTHWPILDVAAEDFHLTVNAWLLYPVQSKECIQIWLSATWIKCHPRFLPPFTLDPMYVNRGSSSNSLPSIFTGLFFSSAFYIVLDVTKCTRQKGDVVVQVYVCKFTHEFHLNPVFCPSTLFHMTQSSTRRKQGARIAIFLVNSALYLHTVCCWLHISLCSHIAHVLWLILSLIVSHIHAYHIILRLWSEILLIS